ncbi:putative baseplate assembly protein [Parafrankia soli]|uniref:Putative baseplate assembly protein n=1 Tax=Parafrankia soli TaxID=2599596 RepID=A0A1S1PWV5_9ACTN|nr:putative baseplate assembly protein [Parafrankia soli]OHV25741.1 putative baseplate assembly protein [Parafrankia soli]
MMLPAPNLDDRTFQQLVDDAKRFIADRCPTWTNHNVSDPGVTLVETFAWMTDLLLYRLNRVPDRNYVRFLDLVGVRLFPPVAARAEVSFRLSAQQDATVRIAKGTVVSTRRTATERAIEFTTMADLDIVPARSVVVASSVDGETLRDHTRELGFGSGFACFDERPKAGDALYIGFDRPAPSLIVLLRFTCMVSGHGIDPLRPPLRWEAWDGRRWSRCSLEQDTTNGLNTTGVIELHLPRTHGVRDVGGVTSAWLRCRVVERRGVPAYRESPRIVSVVGAAVGGDVDAVHGAQVAGAVLGISEGVAGQTFRLSQVPVPTTSEPIVIEVSADDTRRNALPAGLPSASPAALPTTAPTGSVAVPAGDGSAPDSPDGNGNGSGAGTETADGWSVWQLVDSFASSGPDDRHVMVDPTTGVVGFGPLVRLADGSVRQYGAVPPKGSVVRVRPYQTGGGRIGNVVARSLNTLRSSIPYVAAVYNRQPASGGVDGETIEEAKVRGPLALRHRDRAVTAEDFEVLARQAAPETARVRCVVEESGQDAGAVRVLVVPRAAGADGRLALTELVVPDTTGEAIRGYLDARRVVGVRVSVEPPRYVGVTVVARLRCAATAHPDRVREDALTALYRFLNPVSGGPDGTGWPFGRAVHVGDVFGVLQAVSGVAYVDEALLFQANPVTRERFSRVERLDLPPTSLVFSFEHQIDAVRAQAAG